jgi:hypothetical protein
MSLAYPLAHPSACLRMVFMEGVFRLIPYHGNIAKFGSIGCIMPKDGANPRNPAQHGVSRNGAWRFIAVARGCTALLSRFTASPKRRLAMKQPVDTPSHPPCRCPHAGQIPIGAVSRKNDIRYHGIPGYDIGAVFRGAEPERSGD